MCVGVHAEEGVSQAERALFWFRWKMTVCTHTQVQNSKQRTTQTGKGKRERDRQTEAETDTKSSLISMSHQLHSKRDGQPNRQADRDREVSQLCFDGS